MKSQNLTINVSSITMMDTYKNVVDTFGGLKRWPKNLVLVLVRYTNGQLANL